MRKLLKSRNVLRNAVNLDTIIMCTLLMHVNFSQCMWGMSICIWQNISCKFHGIPLLQLVDGLGLLRPFVCPRLSTVSLLDGCVCVSVYECVGVCVLQLQLDAVACSGPIIEKETQSSCNIWLQFICALNSQMLA